MDTLLPVQLMPDRVLSGCQHIHGVVVHAFSIHGKQQGAKQRVRQR